MLSGPETTRILRQFEEQYLPDREGDDHLNHEMGASAQKTFKKQVNHLANVIRRMGNPFLDDFPELITLDSRDCLDDSVAESVFNLQELGKTQYQQYVKDVIQDRSISIGSTIKRNKLPRYSKQPTITKSKQSKKIKTLQNNVALFARLYIAMESRDADLEEFFSHEVQSFPPSLSEFGNLRLPSMKSDLLKCIIQPQQPESPSLFDCKIFDGAVLVHCLPVTGADNFDDYAEKVFIPYISSQSSQRVDVVWDAYVPDSLKEATREKRGKGVRRKVSGSTKLPPFWVKFLRDSANKEELFQFLTSKVAVYNWPEGRSVYITSGFNTICMFIILFP